MSYKHIFGIDPGEVNCGFVWIKYDSETKKGDTRIKGIHTPDAMYNLLKIVWEKSQSDSEAEFYFVAENFRVNNSHSDPRKQTYFWDEVKTIRVIGALELAAKWCGTELVLQEPGNVLSMARKWAEPIWGKAMKKKHLDDDVSAWCHAVHFMMNKKWIGVPEQIAIFGQERL